ncbi:4065_t:CDS:2 [Funneliformis geosporum]|uniref:4065_t:CDS:1 n=1 Tax=Funneliformis geosporum TaxID=1117311 RepID=A0A9W4WXZ7_9GLOM|nr:4065_t:CDS:2 [Funneliformis geosporum]
MEDPEYFNKLVDNVDLSYIGGEEEPAQSPPKSGILLGKTWDTFTVDEVDIAKCFISLRKSMLKTSPKVHPPYWGVLDLTGQHKPTMKMFSTKWNELTNDFDLMWDGKWSTLINLSTIFLIIWRELMVCFVAPAFRMSLDPNQEIFQKLWSEQQLVASQERRRHEQDPNDERVCAGQKTDIITVLPTGPTLEGLICEVSGGLRAKKIWTDKLKLMTANISFVADLQMNLYIMDI